MSFISEKLIVDSNDVFYFDQEADELPTISELSELLSAHQNQIKQRFNRLQRYYRGDHDIKHKMKKAKGKPDNRIVINFAEELVNNEVGYFAGTPVQFDYTGLNAESVDKSITDFVTINDLADDVAELSKQVDIFGRSYMIIYQNENKETRVKPIDPRYAFVVYDSTVESRPLFAIHYSQSAKTGTIKGTYYTQSGKQDFISVVAASAINFIDENEVPYEFGGLPIVEFYGSLERIGLYENVLSLIDAIEVAMSNKGNDIDYFSNTIMKIINATMSQGDIKTMIDKRVINVRSVGEGKDVDIEFLNKPDADNIQEHFIERAIDMIYTKSGVANFNDDVFSNASGTALDFKLQAMSNKANVKERKFTAALREVFKLAFNIGATLPRIPGAEKDMKFTFKRTVPHNIQDEANTAKTLLDVTDQRTALSTLSIVDDPDEVIKAKKAEQKENAQSMMSAINSEGQSDAQSQNDEVE